MKKFLILFFFIFENFVYSQLLTWQDCVKEATNNNPLILSAKATLEQAKNNAWLPKSSVLPSVSLSGSASRAKNDFAELSSDPTSYSYGISLRQILFDGFKSINEIQKSNEEIEIAEINYKITSADIRYRLRKAYIDLMKAQELLNMTEEIYLIRQKQFKDIKMRYEAGREHKGSLLNSEASLQQAEFEKKQAQRDLELAQKQLAKELNRQNFSDLKVVVDFNLKEKINMEPDFEELLKKNYNYIIYEKSKKIAEYSLATATGDFLPTINFSGNMSGTGDSFPPHDNINWSAGIDFSFTLFDGGALLARKNSADEELKKAEKELEYAKNDIYLNIQKAWYELIDASKIKEIQENFLLAAKERSKIADIQYSNGLLSFDNWVIIQDNLVNSKKSFLNSEVSVLLSEANWIKIKGGTLEDEIK